MILIFNNVITFVERQQQNIYFTLFFKRIILSNVLPAGPSSRAVYGRSPAEIVGSNPTGGKDVCLL